MSGHYVDMMRGQRRRTNTIQLTSKTLLALLAIVAMAGSAAYWWGVQSQLTDNRIVAIAYTAILVLAPPSLVSFLIPWSPAGMLLQKVNLRTIGSVVVIVCALYLLYYSYQIQWSWWSAQPVVRDTNLVDQQMLIGIIGFIIIPALLWTPVSSDELVEQVRQAHLVKRYELQTQADIAILRATLLRAQQLALKGFANLTIQERQELSGVMHGLMSSIDRTLREVGDTVKTVSGVAMPFDGMLDDNEDIRGVLDYISHSLIDSEFNRDEGSRQDTALQTQLLEQAPPEDQRITQRGVRENRYYDDQYSEEYDTRRLQRDAYSYDERGRNVEHDPRSAQRDIRSYDERLRDMEHDPRSAQRSRAQSRIQSRRERERERER